MHQLILAKSYFDGLTRQVDGPYAILLEHERIVAVAPAIGFSPCAALPKDIPTLKAEFVMPGLVEAHSHIFLDGGELELATRAKYRKAPFAEMMDVARRNLAAALRCGVTLIRDAGDKYGVNHALRAEVRQGKTALPDLRSPGLGIRRPNRYGDFMAYEATHDEDIVAVVNRIAQEGADDLKIVLTGIIDFATGQVKDEPQFDERALALLVGTARACGLKTFAHCSGLSGLQVAVAVGVDSVEHGFFMTADILKRMADKGIAWVPTCSPVHFQWARPEIVGWDEVALRHLRKILDDHLRHVALAHQMGVRLVAGSDAGSLGVRHGRALVDELMFFLEAGIPLAAVLESATSLPRRLWGVAGGMLSAGDVADLTLLNGDPFKDARHLYEATAVIKHGELVEFSVPESLR